LGRNACFAIFALALAVRLAAIVATGAGTARFGDAPPYLNAARMLAETGRYPFRTDPYYSRAPGYPAFLAIVTLGHPERVIAAKTANAIAGALAPLLIAALSARLFPRRSVALLAGSAAALDPSLVLVSIDIQSEPLFLLLLLASGFALLVSLDRPSSNFAVVAGVLLGLAALTRPSAIAVAPLLAAALADRRYPVRIRAHLAAAAALGFFLSVAPWTLRNAVVYHELIPISDVGEFNFYLGNSTQMSRFFDVRDRRDYDAWVLETDRFIRSRMAELASAGVSSPGAVRRAWVRLAIGDGLARPGRAARLLLSKAWDWLRPYPNPIFWPLAVVVGIGLFYLGLYVLGAYGLAVAPRRGASLFALIFLAATMAAHVLTLVSWRYRMPYWDPVLILYSAFAADRLRGPARVAAA
jgi:hypothetical protein